MNHNRRGESGGGKFVRFNNEHSSHIQNSYSLINMNKNNMIKDDMISEEEESELDVTPDIPEEINDGTAIVENYLKSKFKKKKSKEEEAPQPQRRFSLASAIKNGILQRNRSED